MILKMFWNVEKSLGSRKIWSGVLRRFCACELQKIRSCSLGCAGESETFLQKAIQEQGRGRVLDTIYEIQERHDAVKDMEKNLKELHQVFLDMAVLVQAQGEQLDDIESQVARANSFVRGGTERLQTARKYQISSRKWTCYAIILLLVIVLFVVLFTVKPWNKNSSGGSPSPATPTATTPAQSWVISIWLVFWWLLCISIRLELWSWDSIVLIILLVHLFFIPRYE